MLLRVIARLNSAGGGDFFGGRQINEIDPSKRSMMKDAENQAV